MGTKSEPDAKQHEVKQHRESPQLRTSSATVNRLKEIDVAKCVEWLMAGAFTEVEWGHSHYWSGPFGVGAPNVEKRLIDKGAVAKKPSTEKGARGTINKTAGANLWLVGFAICLALSPGGQVAAIGSLLFGTGWIFIRKIVSACLKQANMTEMRKVRRAAQSAPERFNEEDEENKDDEKDKKGHYVAIGAADGIIMLTQLARRYPTTAKDIYNNDNNKDLYNLWSTADSGDDDENPWDTASLKPGQIVYIPVPDPNIEAKKGAELVDLARSCIQNSQAHLRKALGLYGDLRKKCPHLLTEFVDLQSDEDQKFYRLVSVPSKSRESKSDAIAKEDDDAVMISSLDMSPAKEKKEQKVSKAEKTDEPKTYLTCKKAADDGKRVMEFRHELAKARTYLLPAVQLSRYFLALYDKLADSWQEMHEEVKKRVETVVGHHQLREAGSLDCGLQNKLKILERQGMKKSYECGCIEGIYRLFIKRRNKRNQEKKEKGVYYHPGDYDTTQSFVERFLMTPGERKELWELRKAGRMAKGDERKTKKGEIIRRFNDKAETYLKAYAEKNGRSFNRIFSEVKTGISRPQKSKGWIPKDPVEILLASRFKVYPGKRDDGRMDPMVATSQFRKYHGHGANVRFSFDDLTKDQQDKCRKNQEAREKDYTVSLAAHRKINFPEHTNDADEHRWQLFLRDLLAQYDYPGRGTRISHSIGRYYRTTTRWEKFFDVLALAISLGVEAGGAALDFAGMAAGAGAGPAAELFADGLYEGATAPEDFIEGGIFGAAVRAIDAERHKPVRERDLKKDEKKQEDDDEYKKMMKAVVGEDVSHASFKKMALEMQLVYKRIGRHFYRAACWWRMLTYEMEDWKKRGTVTCGDAFQTLLYLYEFQHELDKGDRYLVYTMRLLRFMADAERFLTSAENQVVKAFEKKAKELIKSRQHQKCGGRACCYGPQKKEDKGNARKPVKRLEGKKVYVFDDPPWGEDAKIPDREQWQGKKWSWASGWHHGTAPPEIMEIDFLLARYHKSLKIEENVESAKEQAEVKGDKKEIKWKKKDASFTINSENVQDIKYVYLLRIDDRCTRYYENEQHPVDRRSEACRELSARVKHHLELMPASVQNSHRMPGPWEFVYWYERERVEGQLRSRSKPKRLAPSKTPGAETQANIFFEIRELLEKFHKKDEKKKEETDKKNLCMQIEKLCQEGIDGYTPGWRPALKFLKLRARRQIIGLSEEAVDEKDDKYEEPYEKEEKDVIPAESEYESLGIDEILLGGELELPIDDS